jgi:hypothetical protein
MSDVEEVIVNCIVLRGHAVAYGAFGFVTWHIECKNIKLTLVNLIFHAYVKYVMFSL